MFTAAYDAENRLTSLEYTDKLGVARKTEYAYSGDDFLAIVKQYEDGTLTDETRIYAMGSSRYRIGMGRMSSEMNTPGA